MLKTRLIANLIVKNDIVVQSIGFKKYLPIGKPEIAVEFLNSWGIDEIILVDIDATKESRQINLEKLKNISKKCFVPLTVGGGIKTVEEMKELVKYGADKIAINTAAVKNPELISKGAKVLGDQCIIVSIDVKKNQQEEYEVFISNGKEATGIHPVNWAKQVQELGAGEILLNSIDKDGSKTGYDLDLIRKVVNAVFIPVIAVGGAGKPQHFQDGIELGKATAVAAANYFHFTEHSVITTKAFLKQPSLISLRLETHAKYDQCSFETHLGRLKKKNDDYFEKIRFEYHPKEVI
jgi:imidazole glycerol-phosphate synthase subunit HisF